MADHELINDGRYIDIGDKPYDNKPKNVDNDGEHVIRLDEQQPLNDPNCSHKLKDGSTAFVLDGEELGNTVAWICSKCHRGTFLPKDVTIT